MKKEEFEFCFALGNAGPEASKGFDEELKRRLSLIEEVEVREQKIMPGEIRAAAFGWSLLVEAAAYATVDILIKTIVEAIIEAYKNNIKKRKEDADPILFVSRSEIPQIITIKVDGKSEKEIHQEISDFFANIINDA